MLTDEEISRNLPAQFGVNSNNLPAEVIERAVHNLRLDAKLNLETQAQFDAADLVNQDIDALFKETEYEEVTKKDIENLFQIPAMQRNVAAYNFFHKYKFSAASFGAFALCAYFTVTSGAALTHIHLSLGLATVAWIGVVALFVATVGFLVHIFAYLDDSMIPRHPRIDVKLKVEDIGKTAIKIPYGAKLRLEEAHDSQKFDHFYICRPQVELTNVQPKPKVIDPAIIGVKRNKVSGTEKWYMIVFWDIPKDIDATEKRIKQLKRFKLH